MARLLHEQGRNGKALELLDALAPCFKRTSAANDVQRLFELIDSMHARTCDACASGVTQIVRSVHAVA
jgi:thioesterase domain-containing protein